VSEPALVSDAAEIEAAAKALGSAPLVAFDLEFVSADRLVPQLCLLQVAWLDAGSREDVPHVRLLDPLAGDVTPVVHALAAHGLVVAHAPRQDLGLLATRFEITMPGIIDTQLMAAFAGIGDQVGLAGLLGDLLGVTLGKELQWTNWAARPLSAAHLAYAQADVLHLPRLYRKLAARLGERLVWVREESLAIAADALAAARVTPETAWEQIGGLRALDPAARAAAISLAAWRHRTAAALDKPLGQVMSEKTLVELARARPEAAGPVRGTKGLSQHARQRADEIVASIAASTPADEPARPARTAASGRAQRWAEILLSIVQLVSAETGIAPRLLGTRADAEDFARAFDEGGEASVRTLPALATWRASVIGDLWLGWLAGRVGIAGDASSPLGVKLAGRT
jgi:ribonuclease D